MQKRQILLTNDDGIRSPGLWAAAEALSTLGFVTVAAPREQSSGTGRSLPLNSDGIITAETVTVNGKQWTVYSVGGSPAQVIEHGVLEIMPHAPDLVVSGINYGENVGPCITVSGTIGAAMEGAAMGFPAMAVSLETDSRHYFSYSTDVDFSAAAHFSLQFARLLLEKRFPADMDFLKIDVPCDATPRTAWRLTRLSRRRYFLPTPPPRRAQGEPGRIGFEVRADFTGEPQDSDVYTLRLRREVSVTPLSLDATARVDFDALEHLLRAD